jgi:CheY-like chemotaxis protein
MRKVLVGESNYAEFEVLNDYLTGKGFEVHWVKSGPDAVNNAAQLHPDLMILDALIPGLTGLKVCQKVKKSDGGQGVKTVLLSKVYRQFKEQYQSRQTMGVDAYSEKPVNMADLDKVINRLIGDLKTPPPLTPEEAKEAEGKPAAEGKRTLGTKGSLSETPFPRLLFYLHKFKRTGALRVMHEQISKVIYLRDGDPVFVTSNLSNESLGRFMVQRGLITDEQYNTSLQRMLETSKQHGNVLLDMGLITPHQLFEALQGQIREKILRVFAWDEGEYEFRPGAFSMDENVRLGLPALKLILDGVKRFYSLSRLERYFNEYKNQRLRRMKNSMLAKGEMFLTPREAKFFKLVDGKGTVGKIVARSSLSLSETFQMLYFLLLTEVIRFVGDPGFATRGIKEQEAFLADRRRRQAELRGLKDDKGMVLDDRRRRYRLAVSRTYDMLGDINHYELLKIPTDADAEHVRSAYHTLARQYRPYDLYQDAEPQLKDMSDKVFGALTNAYETLLDAQARRTYNEKLWGKAEPPADAIQPPPLEPELEFEPEPELELEFEPEAAAGDDFVAPADVDFGDQPADAVVDLDDQPAAPLDDAEFDFGPELSFDEPAAEPEPPATDAGFADFTPEDEKPADEDVDTPDIEWDVGEDLAAGSETDAQRELRDFSLDATSNDEVAAAGEVTESMANLVRSELSFQAGEDAMHRKDYAAAIKNFDQARQLNPKEAEYFAFLGWATFLAAPDDEAARRQGRDLMEQAVSINPVLDSGYTFLAMLNLHEGNHERARGLFEQALQYNPENAHARAELAKLESM